MTVTQYYAPSVLRRAQRAAKVLRAWEDGDCPWCGSGVCFESMDGALRTLRCGNTGRSVDPDDPLTVALVVLIAAEDSA